AMNADFVIMRHQVSLSTEFLARNTSASVINAGDGNHAHPTQALLDSYSLLEKRGSLKGMHIGIVGDIKHSRVARSDIEAFQKLGAKVTLCGPPTLLPDEFRSFGCDLTYDLDALLPQLDAVNMLRIQKERQKGSHFPSIREYHELFAMTEKRLKQQCKKDIIVMHPGPMNRGVEIDDYVADSPNAIINEQVTNGIAVRMAVFYLLMGGKPLDSIENE
ncbi:MAG: aspartate carbamoyltransferase catalytic subunit, partial [Spirochaetota bacterium]